MHNTPVQDLMEQELITVSPDETLQVAGRKMKEAGCGILPVGMGEAAEGVITDRDIVMRAVALGLDPAVEKVRDHMSLLVQDCDMNETVAEAARKMRESNIGRLVVTDGAGRMRGILTFGRILRNFGDAENIAQAESMTLALKDAPVSAGGAH